MSRIREELAPWAQAAAVGALALAWRVGYLGQVAEDPLLAALAPGDGYGRAGSVALGTAICLQVWWLGRTWCGWPTGLVAGVMAACYGPFIHAGAGGSVGVAFLTLAGAILLTVPRVPAVLPGLLLGLAGAMAGPMILLAGAALWWAQRERSAWAAIIGWAVGFVGWTLWSDGWAGLVPAVPTEWPMAMYNAWRGGEWTPQGDPYLAAEGTVLTWLLWQRGVAFPFGVVAPLALLGLWGLQRAAGPEARLVLWGSLAGMAGVAVYGGDPTVRLVAVPLLLVAAAWALVAAWRQRTDRRRLAVRMVSVGILALACNVGEDAQRLPGTAAEYFARGAAYEDLSMSANAIREYERSVATGVASTAAYAALGRLYATAGEYARAIGAYRSLVQRRPDDGDARLALARAYMLAERPREAAAQADTLVRTKPNGDRLLGLLGDARLMAGDASGALEAYGAMVEAQPDSVRVLYHLARLYESEGFKGEALAAYHRLRAHAPWRAEAGWRAAALLAERGDTAEAEALLRSVLAEDTDNRPALWGLGRLLAVAGRHGEALPLFERLRVLEPEDYRTHFFLGKLYFRLDRRAEAETALARYQIGKRRAEVKRSVEDDLNAVLRQFGEWDE